VAALKLEALWDDAIEAATQDGSFDTLCAYLEKDLKPSPPSYPVTWRFSAKLSLTLSYEGFLF
jgi:hypothetical protein